MGGLPLRSTHLTHQYDSSSFTLHCVSSLKFSVSSPVLIASYYELSGQFGIFVVEC